MLYTREEVTKAVNDLKDFRRKYPEYYISILTVTGGYELHIRKSTVETTIKDTQLVFDFNDKRDTFFNH